MYRSCNMLPVDLDARRGEGLPRVHHISIKLAGEGFFTDRLQYVCLSSTCFAYRTASQ